MNTMHTLLLNQIRFIVEMLHTGSNSKKG